MPGLGLNTTIRIGDGRAERFVDLCAAVRDAPAVVAPLEPVEESDLLEHRRQVGREPGQGDPFGGRLPIRT